MDIMFLKDRRRRPEGGEWEPIKIHHRNLAYVLKSIWNPSLLTRPVLIRPHERLTTKTRLKTVYLLSGISPNTWCACSRNHRGSENWTRKPRVFGPVTPEIYRLHPATFHSKTDNSKSQPHGNFDCKHWTRCLHSTRPRKWSQHRMKNQRESQALDSVAACSWAVKTEHTTHGQTRANQMATRNPRRDWSRSWDESVWVTN
jgi:hypothetical protein